MGISFNEALGVHDKALQFRSQRAAILSENLANADTPNFKARDISFQTALQQAAAGPSRFPLERTAAEHIAGQSMATGAETFYRVPTQPSIDGNTVEVAVEEAQFARNAQEFQVSFTLLNSKFRGLMTALRGE